MNLLGLLFLVLIHSLTGYSLLTQLKIRVPNQLVKIALSIVLGVGLASFIPMLLEIAGLRINKISLGISLVLMALIPLAFAYRSTYAEIKSIQWKIPGIKFTEVAILGVVTYLLLPGIFMNYFLPSNPRDFTSGPEVVAEFTIRESQINNSVFEQDMSTTNNHQKPYSLVGLQVIYKSFVQPIGQVWNSLLVISFFFFLYYYLRLKIHPVLTGLMLLLTISVPEMYAYVVLVLFDYSNMVLVTFAFIFLLDYLKYPDRTGNLVLVSILLGIATFFRSETMILAFFIIGMVLFWKLLNQEKLNLIGMIKEASILTVGSVVVYLLSIELFIRNILPSGFDTGSNVNSNLFDLSPLFDRLGDMLNVLMFSRAPVPDFPYYGVVLYGEIFWLLLVFVVSEAVIGIKNKGYKNKEALFWLVAFTLTWFFIGFTGYLLPLADLGNSTKRAMFKLVPLAVLFIGSTSSLQYISKFFYRIERVEVKPQKKVRGPEKFQASKR